MNSHIRFENAQEYFRMCGPWLADCYLDNKKLKHKFLADNLATSDDDNFLVLSRYITHTVYDDRPTEFNVIVIDLKTKLAYISNEAYDSLFIESMKDENISIFRAFHDSYPEYKESLKFSDQTFSILDNSYFYDSVNQ